MTFLFNFSDQQLILPYWQKRFTELKNAGLNNIFGKQNGLHPILNQPQITKEL